MSKKSFEITSSLDFFNALKGAVDDYSRDKTSSRKAIAAFMFAYHLREWIWKEHKVLVENKLGCKNQSEFYSSVNRIHQNFPLIRDICNSSKHFDQEMGPVNTSGLTGGAFSSAFSSGFDIGKLTVTDNSKTIPATQLLSEVISYYEQIFCDLGLL